jgi:hypothetical protein
MLKKLIIGSSFATVSLSSFAGPFVTTTLGFKAYEVFKLKAENGSEIKIGEGKLSPRPVPIDVKNWQAIGKAIGLQGNLKLCDRGRLSTDELLESMRIESEVTRITLRLKEEYGSPLSPAERASVIKLPNCQLYANTIVELGKVLNLTTDRLALADGNVEQDNFLDGTMISQLSFADEGHGWLTVKNRLTTGQNAIFHLAVKTKQFTGLIGARQHDVSLQYTKQPVALRFVQKHHSRKVEEGYDRTESCTGTKYVDRCTYDPETKTGKCEKVPYTVEGTRTYRVDEVVETYFTQVQFMSSDFSRVLGAADIKNQATYEDKDYGYCVLPDVNDHDHGHRR